MHYYIVLLITGASISCTIFIILFYDLHVLRHVENVTLVFTRAIFDEGSFEVMEEKSLFLSLA